MSDDKTAIYPPSNPGETDLLDDPRVVEILAEYQRELEAGRRPGRKVFLDRHPELASAIAECLDGLELIQRGKSDSGGKSRGGPLKGMTESALLPTTAPLGDFQIIGEIARGGMGVVYEALQLSLGRRVALKVLPFAVTLDPRHLQRFKIEAQTAALLHHTHIVPIYAVGCERGVHFYAMQLIEGQSLATVVSQLRLKEGRAVERSSSWNVLSGDQGVTGDGRFAAAAPALASPLHSTADVSVAVTAGNALASEGYIRRICRLMMQAADALEHAHQSGVVHRDIKPANLLIDRAGNLWITDFGLAQLQSDNGMTRSNDMLGTFRYMSPEQAGGQRAVLDHRTDIYSLGATFYELLTLEPAFSAASHQELFYQILHVEPRRVRELNRAIPAELETIVFKALSKSPAERYATAADFAADVQRYLEHQPILARPPSLAERAKKWSRRHPAVVIGGMVVLFVVAVASLVTTWRVAVEQQRTAQALAGQQQRAEEAERHFQQARQAVDALFQISEEELADRPGEGARRRILEVVLSYYQDFIEERRGDEASQAELAQVQEKVRGILHELDVLQRAMDNRLLSGRSVQQELKLSEDQRTALQAQLARWNEERPSLFESLRELNETDRRVRLVAVAEQQERELDELLSQDQIGRFRQIAIQSRGLFAFKEPAVVKALELTQQQRARIREIEREMFAAQFRPGGPGDRGPGPPFLDRAKPAPGDGPPPRRPGPDSGPGHRPGPKLNMQPWVNKALAEMTSQQVQQWRNLTGEPFTAFENEGFPGPPR